MDGFLVSVEEVLSAEWMTGPAELVTDVCLVITFAVLLLSMLAKLALQAYVYVVLYRHGLLPPKRDAGVGEEGAAGELPMAAEAPTPAPGRRRRRPGVVKRPGGSVQKLPWIQSTGTILCVSCFVYSQILSCFILLFTRHQLRW
ncbi:hypothetical protein BRADI_4g44451v3 [Brachypodium distachyon]|uniref:Uncharacterized protein n=1 Tax=Brachypodium distachyon TaxID=15368 RepID=A0A0Q3LJ65_BRADI|nr:hypothetical protein BRADI_4g44451v3 [Brachypodium distachyon]